MLRAALVVVAPLLALVVILGTTEAIWRCHVPRWWLLLALLRRVVPLRRVAALLRRVTLLGWIVALRRVPALRGLLLRRVALLGRVTTLRRLLLLRRVVAALGRLLVWRLSLVLLILTLLLCLALLVLVGNSLRLQRWLHWWLGHRYLLLWRDRLLRRYWNWYWLNRGQWPLLRWVLLLLLLSGSLLMGTADGSVILL